MAATQTRRHRRSRRPERIPLREDIVRAGKMPLKVDRDKGIIYGVKVLGFESANGRRYLPEAVERAVRFYEGISVYFNHPKAPADSRNFSDKFGRLVGLKMEPDGLYGNLEYLKSHPHAELLCEAAERMPEMFGLSHNAQGDGDYEDGIFIVREIVEVRSVDIVTEPATTSGLNEERRPAVKIKLKALAETNSKAFDLPRRQKLKKLMEEGYMDPEMEVDGGGEGEEGPGLEDHLCDMVASIIRDDKIPFDEKKKKIAHVLGLLKEDGDEEKDLEEEEDEDEKEGDKEEKEDKDKMESRIKKLERENLVHKLAAKDGIKVDEVLMEALLNVPEKSVKPLLEREKGRQSASRPRSGAGGGTGSGPGGLPDSVEGRMARLRD